jgi:hypothetical protein
LRSASRGSTLYPDETAPAQARSLPRSLLDAGEGPDRLRMPMTTLRGRCLLVSVFASTVVGCKAWSERGAKGLGTLPQAAPNESNFSPYHPARPYQQLAKGLLGRKAYETAVEAGVVVQVFDLLVGPNQHTESFSFDAPSLLEVKSGSGSLTAGASSRDINGGMVVTLPAGQPFTIANQSALPITLNVEVLGSKQR